jgi:hypothetical protein
MVEDAEKMLTDLGLISALDRRFANPNDLNIANAIYVDRTEQKTGLFNEVKDELAINSKTLSKVETMTLTEFVEKVVPNSTSIELLLENKHEPNLVSLIAPVDPDAGLLFKWDNRYSWSYNNAVADSMKERVKEAGGKVDGVLRFSIQWNEDGKSIVDLDAHAFEPNGTQIMYNTYRGLNSKTSMSGNLDVDMRSPSHVGVENITWSDKRLMKHGVYRFFIRNFNGRPTKGFSAEIEFNGELYSFGTDKDFRGDVQIAEVTYSKDGFSIKSLMDSTSTVNSKDVWGMSTNKFHKVKSIVLSPNFWGDDKIGNLHTFFMLEKANNTGVVRGFFNEFLKEDLNKHRKVFEALGAKSKVEYTPNQLSGVGFSSTNKGEFFVKVTGKFTRTLKITI